MPRRSKFGIFNPKVTLLFQKKQIYLALFPIYVIFVAN